MNDQDEPQAGPELDRRIAEKVLRREAAIVGGECRISRPDGAESGTVCFLEGSDAWSPSTNIAAAWEVIAAMADEHGLDYRLFCAVAPAGGLVHCAEFGGAGEARAPTAPLAICRAALRAMDPGTR